MDVDGVLTVLDTEEEIRKRLNVRTAKLDLHVGSEYYLFYSADIPVLSDPPRTLQAGQKIVLRPGDGLIIKSREYLVMPRDLAGIVSSKVGFTLLGLTPISTTVDPTFEGFLVLVVRNHGNDEIHLTCGDAIATMTLMQTEAEVPEHDKVRSQTGNLFECVWGAILKDFIDDSQANHLSDVFRELEQAEIATDKPYHGLILTLRRRMNRRHP